MSAHERRSSARAELERRSRALVSAHERRSSATSARALGERSYERFNVDFSARCAHMSARSARALLVLLLPINPGFIFVPNYGLTPNKGHLLYLLN